MIIIIITPNKYTTSYINETTNTINIIYFYITQDYSNTDYNKHTCLWKRLAQFR